MVEDAGRKEVEQVRENVEEERQVERERERQGEVGDESREGSVSVNYCLQFGMEPVHVNINQQISEYSPGQ